MYLQFLFFVVYVCLLGFEFIGHSFVECCRVLCSFVKFCGVCGGCSVFSLSVILGLGCMGDWVFRVAVEMRVSDGGCNPFRLADADLER